MTAPRSRRGVSTVIGLFACLAVVLPGCGGDDDGESTTALTDGPAALVPPGAPVYAEAVVRPEGDQGEELDSALGTLLATDDPGAKAIEGFDQILSESDSGLTWAEDVEPWLGERAGLFVASTGGGQGDDPDVGVVIETTDPDAATTAIDKAFEAQGDTTKPGSYSGVDYEVSDNDGSATGIVEDDLVAASSVDVFESIVDTATADGESMADSEALAGDFADARDDSIVTVYADPTGILDALEATGAITAEQRGAVETQLEVGQYGVSGGGPVVASLAADDDDFSAEVVGAAAEGTSEPDASLVEDLPSDSWLAFGASDYGAMLGKALDGIDAQLQAMPLQPPELRGGIEGLITRELGLDVRDDLLSWIGDVSGYARGTSIFGLNVAAIIETTDETASASALGAIGKRLARVPQLSVSPVTGDQQGFEIAVPGAPVQIPVVQTDGKVIAGLGQDSIDTALDPDSTLGDSDAFEDAADALDGTTPALFLDFEPIVELIEGTGQATSDPDYQEAKPYLDALDYFTAGSSLDGDRATGRVVLGVDGD